MIKEKAVKARSKPTIRLAVLAILAAVPLSETAAAMPRPAQSTVAAGGNAGLTLIQNTIGFSVGDILGLSGEAVPLDVKLPENPAGSYSFLMFRNMPKDFKLSGGFGTKTYWAVSLNDVEGLKMIPPEDYTGSFKLEVLLVKSIGVDPVRHTADVTITPPPENVSQASGDDASGQLLTSTRPGGERAASDDSSKRIQDRLVSSNDRALNQQERNSQPQPTQQARLSDAPEQNAAPQAGVPMTGRDRTLMRRGDRLLRQGDIASARLLYRQLAKKGIAEGAFAMGSTYDPEFLAGLGVQGLRPDVEQAAIWYRKARELGSPNAESRLSAIGARRY